MVSIPYSDWLRLKTQQEQQQHLFAAIQAASTKQPVAARGFKGSPLTDATASQSPRTPKAWRLGRLWRLFDV